jgi:hypothetical protein
MIEPRFLQALFVDTFEATKQRLEGITHSDSLKQPPYCPCTRPCGGSSLYQA